MLSVGAERGCCEQVLAAVAILGRHDRALAAVAAAVLGKRGRLHNMSGTGESSALEEDAPIAMNEGTDSQFRQALTTSSKTRSSASEGISEPALSVISGETDAVATLDCGEREACAPSARKRVRPVIRNKNRDKDEIAALVTAW